MVEDAVKAAGGAVPDADLEQINLAQELHDQQQINVPRRGKLAGASVTPVLTPSVIRSTPTAVSFSTPQPIPAPTLILPGEGELVRQALFQWKGTLPSGAAFVVKVVFDDGKPALTSHPLFQTFWVTDLPAAQSGGWSWQVSVINQSDGRSLARSSTVHFWYVPISGSVGEGAYTGTPFPVPPELP
jgi:hypothetical protein